MKNALANVAFGNFDLKLPPCMVSNLLIQLHLSYSNVLFILLFQDAAAKIICRFDLSGPQ